MGKLGYPLVVDNLSETLMNALDPFSLEKCTCAQMELCIHPHDMYSSSSYWVPGHVLGARDPAVSKTQKFPSSRSLVGGQTDHKQNNQVSSILEDKDAKVKNRTEKRRQKCQERVDVVQRKWSGNASLGR